MMVMAELVVRLVDGPSKLTATQGEQCAVFGIQAPNT